MSRSMIAGVSLLCSVLLAGPACAAETIRIDLPSHAGGVFMPLRGPGSSVIGVQPATAGGLGIAAVPGGDLGNGRSTASAASAGDTSGSAWLVGAGFGTIFLIAARRRRPDIQGV
jgi:hypothetical protein